jgi:hypothetical protein
VNVGIRAASVMVWGAVRIDWPSAIGVDYSVQKATNLLAVEWQDLHAGLSGNGTTNTMFDTTRTSRQGFYRVSGFAGEARVSRAVEIGWRSLAGMLYDVQWSTNLPSSQWHDLYAQVKGNGTTNSVFDAPRHDTQTFYRVIVANQPPIDNMLSLVLARAPRSGAAIFRDAGAKKSGPQPSHRNEENRPRKKLACGFGPRVTDGRRNAGESMEDIGFELDPRIGNAAGAVPDQRRFLPPEP